MNQSEWSPFRSYGGRRKRWPDVIAVALLCCLGLWLTLRATRLPEYDWYWKLLFEFVIRQDSKGAWHPGMLLQGLFTTLRIGFWTLLFSLLAGGALGMAFAGRSFVFSLPYRLYVNLARNTPPLVILFSIYFFAGNMLPVTGIENALRHSPQLREVVALVFAPPGQLDRMLAAILALGLYQSAYVAEIVRSGIESVNQGQMDAALALGFPKHLALALVVLPQAAALMLPPLTGQAITIFKDSALASLISLPDLTFQCLEAMAVSRMTFEIWISGAILYLLVGAMCVCAGSFMESRFTFHK